MLTDNQTVLSFFVGFASCASLFSVAFLIYHTKQHRTHEREVHLDAIQNHIVQSQSGDMLENLKTEQLSRNTTFLGEANQKKLNDKYVIIVGLGGVGSHAAYSLAKCGVGKLKLVDFDQVTLSTLNRHACAVRIDVGTSKVACMKKYINSLAPWCEVEALQVMFKKDNSEETLLPPNCVKPDYILDCIDDIRTKIQLLHFCCVNNIRVISSCGAGGKSDPTRIHITNIVDVSTDPLAARVKMELRTRLKGIVTARNSFTALTEDEQSEYFISKINEIEAVYSSEKPTVKLLPLSEAAAKNPKDYGTVDQVRLRVMPVLGTMPALFGTAMAARVITNLVNLPFLPSPVPSMTSGTYNRLRVRFCGRMKNLLAKVSEEDRNRYNVRGIDREDVDFIVTFCKRRCVLSFDKWQRNKIELALWRYDEGVKVGNVVLVKGTLLHKLDSLILSKTHPTPSNLDIAEKHFEKVEQLLTLMSNNNTRSRSPSGLVDHILSS